VVLCNSDEDPEREARHLQIAVSEHMAGVILVPAGGDSDVTALVERGRPVVSVDRALHGSPVDSVVVDNLAGGRAATTRLYERGAHRVACITGPEAAETAQLRSAAGRRCSPSGRPGRTRGATWCTPTTGWAAGGPRWSGCRRTPTRRMRCSWPTT
jgi:LacI family transcriptional regulator